MKRLFVYRPGHPAANERGFVELGAEDIHVDARVSVMSDLYMDGVRATDGVDIGSRKKRRAYMKAMGLADADDFKNEWADAAKERERFFRGESDRGERREAIAQAIYQGRKP